MKQQSIVKNYIYNLSYQLLVLIVPLVTTPYLSRVLGDTNIGIFNFVQSIVSYFVLFGCIGLNLYGQREIASCKADIEARSRTFFEMLSIRVVTISIALIVYYTCVITLTTQTVYFMLFGVELLASLFDVSWYFQGVEHFRIQTVRNFIVKLTGVACIFLFVKTAQDLWVYILCYTATVLFGNIAMIFCLSNSLCLVKPNFGGIKKHVVPALVMFFPQIATSIYARLDKSMIKLLSTYEQVGYYSQADKIVKLVLTVVTAMGIVMLSRVASSFANNDKEQIKGYIIKSFRFLFILAWPCMIGTMVIAEGFVPWFFGENFDAVAPCMILLAPIIIFIGITNVIGTQYLLPTRQMRSYTVSVVIGMLFNAGLNLLLIPKMGCLGAAIATLVAELGVMIAQLWFVRKIFKPTILLCGTKSLISAIVMGVAVYYMTKFMPSAIWATFSQIAVGGVVYLIMLLVLRDKFVFGVINRVLHKNNA